MIAMEILIYAGLFFTAMAFLRFVWEVGIVRFLIGLAALVAVIAFVSFFIDSGEQRQAEEQAAAHVR